MNSLRCIIIEDELNSQKLLKKIIEDYCLDIEINGIADSIDQGLQIINSLHPDIVFADIEVKDGNIFELFDRLERKDFHLIITTAYKDYAFEAFKREAVDYIMKPYNPIDIVNAVNRIKKVKRNRFISENEAGFDHTSNEKVSLSTQDAVYFLKPSDIIYIMADGAYCNVYLNDNSKIMISKSIGDFEKQLNSLCFSRIHNSYIVNTNHIKQIMKLDGGCICLTNGTQLPISRRRRNEIMQSLLNAS
ncbi:MAG: response regulator transcription factor [Lewinellaceae bacterium]|nr:response regulator transcription factor [Lewinellaceae bacterium]